MEKWIVEESESSLSLVAFIRSRSKKTLSSRNIKQMLENNSCLVNGSKERFGSRKLEKGDSVSCESFFYQTQKASFNSSRILFEDEHILAYNKTPDIDVYELEKQLKGPKLVHRLDKDTTGVLLFSKTEKSHKNLLQAFADREIQKEYLTLVYGKPKAKEGRISCSLEKKVQIEGQVIWGISKKGKEAVTDWKLLKTIKNVSLLRCYPKTGRTHQIRIHLVHLGHPVLGDSQYGRYLQKPFIQVNRHILHAESLHFLHPISRKNISIRAEIPEDFMCFGFFVK